jgi:hypothetical protein
MVSAGFVSERFRFLDSEAGYLDTLFVVSLLPSVRVPEERQQRPLLNSSFTLFPQFDTITYAVTGSNKCEGNYITRSFIILLFTRYYWSD